MSFEVDEHFEINREINEEPIIEVINEMNDNIQ